jgi:DNA-binding Xre family transcriptional regulator
MILLLVKEIAEGKGLNRNQLQLMSGVTLPLLTRYWNNATTEIRLDALERIAKALEVKPWELISTEAEVMGSREGIKRYDNLMRRSKEGSSK